MDAAPARLPHSAPLITACLMRAQDGRTDGRGRRGRRPTGRSRTGTKKWKNVLRWRPPLPSIPFLPTVGQGNRPRPRPAAANPPSLPVRAPPPERTALAALPPHPISPPIPLLYREQEPCQATKEGMLPPTEGRTGGGRGVTRESGINLSDHHHRQRRLFPLPDSSSAEDKEIG